MEDEFNWVCVEELESITPQKSQSTGTTHVVSHTGEAFNILDITVDRKADGIMSPVERGNFVFDNKVIKPLTVTVSAIVEERYWSQVWDILLKMYNERSYKFYTVVARGEVVENLMLLAMPRKENAEKFNAVDVTLQFAQVVYANENQKRVENPTHQNTTPTGQKTMRNYEKIKNTPNYGMVLR